MKTTNVLKLKEVTKLLDAEGFTARSKVSAAKYVAMFNGYETARANTKEDQLDAPGIIITTPNGNRMIIWWDSYSWDSYYKKNYTPQEYDMGIKRQEARRAIEDKHFYTKYREVKNKSVEKFKSQRQAQIYLQLQEARNQVKKLEKLYFSY